MVVKPKGYEWEEIHGIIIPPFDPSNALFYYVYDQRRGKVFPYISSSPSVLEPYLQPHTVIKSGANRYPPMTHPKV